MTGSHAQDPAGRPGAASPSGASTQPHRHVVWRLATPLVVLATGGLCVVSAVNSDGTDLRPGRYTSLPQLVQADAQDYQGLKKQAADLTQQVQALTATVDDRQVQRKRRQVQRLLAPAGLEPVSGPGVSVRLSDASSSALDAAAARDANGDDTEINLNELLVHQQDIQAVVNALWAGGARAVTVQGQRIVTTTGIKCSGSVVRLQGVPYPEPYTIQAVGDPASLEEALDDDPRVEAFVADAADPKIGLGWAVEAVSSVDAPAYDGLLDLTSAQPLRRPASK